MARALRFRQPTAAPVRWLTNGKSVPTTARTWNNVTDGAPYSGATTATLAISNVAGLGNYRYRAQVSTVNCAAVTSNSATLTVEGPITITTQPVSFTECSGNAGSFTVAATNAGAGTLTYQWQLSTTGGAVWVNITNGGVYSGATTTNLEHQ